jgi:CxxC motif-containing protein
MEQNNNQITEMKGDLKNIKDICMRNNEWLKEDLKKTKKLLDSHCGRIRNTENDLIEIKTEVKPIINFYNKVGQFTIGLCILIGGVIVGGLYFMKDFLKK